MTNPFDLDNLIKNAKGMMEKAEQNLKKITASSEAGAGLVKVTVNAEHQITQLTLEDSLLSESKETIAELIQSAINDAQRKVGERQRESITSLGKLMQNNPEEKP